MKKIILSIFVSTLLFSCGGSKKASNAVSSGNYQQAFDLAIGKLQKDKTKKSSQKNVPILKEAYDKAATQDKIAITRLEKSKTIDNLNAVYKKYMLMDIRQDEVRALQPLYYEGREYTFQFEDYTEKIAKAKKNVSENLYNTAARLMQSSNKVDSRLAHKHLEELFYLNPDFKNNISSLIDKAKAKSSSFVLVSLNNKIASQLKDSTSISELKSFTTVNTSNFTNPWVIYHTKKDYNVTYDYLADFTLDKLVFVPEKTNQQKVDQKKRVQDGYKYIYDSKGNVMKDKDGNDMKEAKYKDVTAQVVLYQQVKSANINGTMTLKNAKTGAVVSKHPLAGEAKLENVYGKYTGDQRAIDQKYHKALQSKQAKFPKDEVFKKYALENLKQKAMEILNQQKF